MQRFFDFIKLCIGGWHTSTIDSYCRELRSILDGGVSTPFTQSLAVMTKLPPLKLRSGGFSELPARRSWVVSSA